MTREIKFREGGRMKMLTFSICKPLPRVSKNYWISAKEEGDNDTYVLAYIKPSKLCNTKRHKDMLDRVLKAMAE